MGCVGSEECVFLPRELSPIAFLRWRAAARRPTRALAVRHGCDLRPHYTQPWVQHRPATRRHYGYRWKASPCFKGRRHRRALVRSCGRCDPQPRRPHLRRDRRRLCTLPNHLRTSRTNWVT